MESVIDLQKKLKEIEKWEREQKGLWFWEKLGRVPFMILDKVTPKFIHDKIGIAIDELGNYVQSGGSYLVDEKRVLSKQFGNETTIEEVSKLEIDKMDVAAQKISSRSAKTAMIQGGTTGIGGIFTLAIDIPLMLGITLKTIQEIALCYGYNPKEKDERIFVVKCLQFSSSDIVGKKAILEELSLFNDRKSNTQMMSQLQGWREVLTTYRDNFGWKKLFQLIPVAGILFGAYINKSTIQDTAEAAMMLYRKRRVLERLEAKQVEDLDNITLI
ncbi:EcsC family protein [Litchfieldia alkalitelluris]|uniref:EcsC family protein n=1 Tax=Litchfieldia alkalitelluris TaxID=304268 RepID=UPI0009964A00|nr:EcsC family protein [Litchfieldia alkalitelluris]